MLKFVISYVVNTGGEMPADPESKEEIRIRKIIATAIFRFSKLAVLFLSRLMQSLIIDSATVVSVKYDMLAYS